MKKIICIIVVLLTMSSCSPKIIPYRQIGTLSSDNVKLNEKGDFEYSKAGISISYNFWSNGGDVSFVITNNTDKDIYLLKDNCYFVKNGWAFDYYKNRKYTESFASSSSVAQTAGASVSANAQLSGQLSNFAKDMINFKSLNIKYSSAVSVGYGASQMAAGTIARSAQSGLAVETPEQKTVCIPAHSSKHFSDFNISDTPYRQCGFARDAKTQEGEKISFTSASTSPQCIENRLVFNINGEVVPIVNTFYVSEYINILENLSFIREYSKDCNGNNIGYYPDVVIFKHAAPNCFFTTYRYDMRSKDNDRIDNKRTKQTALKLAMAELNAYIFGNKEAAKNIRAELETHLAAKKEATDKEKAEEHTGLAAEQEALAKAKAEEQARLVAEKEATEKAKATEKEAAKEAKVAEKEARAKAKAEWRALPAAEKDIERCINSNIFNLQHLKVDGFTTSYTDLGNQYFYGKGKEFSIEKAFLCYNYGAKRGEAEAFLLIAQYYETGRAHGSFRIEQDSNIALSFYEKAAALQVQGASEGIKRVQSSK